MTVTITQELLPDVVVTYSRGSVDFVAGTVRDRNGNNLSMGVELAITLDEATHLWLPAGWSGTASAERLVTTAAPVTFDAPTYPSDRYGVYVRLDNGTAHPIFRIGTLVITD